MESTIGDLIKPEGWLPWDGDQFLKTLYYAEYGNRGPGAGTSGRSPLLALEIGIYTWKIDRERLTSDGDRPIHPPGAHLPGWQDGTISYDVSLVKNDYGGIACQR
ncbi:hypothetical protein C4D60_Mb06t36090 [Musa balbisiana]|uniref:Pectinesterase catalytic domain-containing protein n=1 Tax=Musa balbisiana TaxID=52838 RepID=A0A4S8IUG7_MUSBA|nr:hypothetical protein C4D60_Mb06t36090 [Musa balbisiana]